MPRELTSPHVNRQQLVTLVFAILGASLLGMLLRLEPGSAQFYVLTFVIAGAWTVGAFAAGPVHLGRVGHGFLLRRLFGEAIWNFAQGRRPVVIGILGGAGIALVFLAGSLVVREIDPLSDAIVAVLQYAYQGNAWLLLLTTVLNGLAEEVFFRGAVYDAVPRYKIAWSTALYVVATALTGNVMLAFAAILLGVVTGYERRVTGGILAPMLTHITWSVTMLYALPAIFPEV